METNVSCVKEEEMNLRKEKKVSKKENKRKLEKSKEKRNK